MSFQLRSVASIGLITSTLLIAPCATADLLGIACETFIGEGWIEHGYDGLSTYRIYADFDGDPGDGVLSVFGLEGIPLTMSSSNGAFHNSPEELDQLTAPQDLRAVGIWANQWDSYVTINATRALGDATSLSPGFATETNNLAESWSTERAGWFVTPADEQSNHIEGRVLLGQFTVESGVAVSGVLGLLLLDGTNHDVPLEISCCDHFCPEDLDQSCDIGPGDVEAILLAWGNKAAPEDLDKNGVVGFGDILVLLVSWGSCE